MLRSPCILVAALATSGFAQSPSKEILDDARLRQAWQFLTAAEQEDVAARFEEEAGALRSFENALIAHALTLEPTDPGLLPTAGAAPIYDPKVHAPAQPIARSVLKPDDPIALEAKQRMVDAELDRSPPSAWRYDWTKREVQRAADPHEPTRVFENALAGRPPNFDLAEAIVEKTLDRGGETKTLAAFAHAYTDRAGNVYPGVTLYDAWSSGAEIEMPDVDVLGIVHDVLGDWNRWKAMIPDSQHRAIYDAVGKLYQRAHKYRALRSALAESYLVGKPALRDGYIGHVLRFHGLWESAKAEPSSLAKELPDAEHAQEYMLHWSELFDRDGAKVQKAQARQATLEQDARDVRATLIRCMKESGALERKSRPEPKKSSTPAGG